jgi:hypothetical protein
MLVEFSKDELFFIEMALDEVLYRLSDPNSPAYQRFKLVDDKVYSLRKQIDKENKE